jgi:hypothetical protein
MQTRCRRSSQSRMIVHTYFIRSEDRCWSTLEDILSQPRSMEGRAGRIAGMPSVWRPTAHSPMILCSSRRKKSPRTR